ncbi:4928_t:CDS:1 [Ambispora gerdemannii]|uniref:4928_t:CDS:1 n=1 Tax=Ambispora gerdemannii TaxID=144530 RepID=A0A9N9GN00_9GLOM|nr:4928_t:CDS:1 [Ambispora gerdemannii]
MSYISHDNIQSCLLNTDNSKIEIVIKRSDCIHTISFPPRTVQRVVDTSNSKAPNYSLIYKASLTDASLPKPCKNPNCLLVNIQFVDYSKLFSVTWKEAGHDVKALFKKIEEEANEIISNSTGSNRHFVHYGLAQNNLCLDLDENEPAQKNNSDLSLDLDENDPVYGEYLNQARRFTNEGSVDTDLFQHFSTMDTGLFQPHYVANPTFDNDPAYEYLNQVCRFINEGSVDTNLFQHSG